MNREYLEDYEQRENAERDRLYKEVREGRFSLERDTFPPDRRFFGIKEPVAFASIYRMHLSEILAQIPFCGSLVITLPPVPKPVFEEALFKETEFESIINFIKDTGRLQVGLPTSNMKAYEKLDYLDPFFKALNPPVLIGLPIHILGDKKDFDTAVDTFYTLGKVKFFDFLIKLAQAYNTSAKELENRAFATYLALKMGGYRIAEEIEDSMIDDPIRASWLLVVSQQFLVEPMINIRYRSLNYDLSEAKRGKAFLPSFPYHNLRFPCEIGKFLMKGKLTYAAQNVRACYDLMDHYDASDLRKVQEALHYGIVTNHPDIVTKSADEISKILDDLWNDKTIPNRIRNIQIGVPVSIAAIGGIVAGLPGLFAGGFLSELGFKVVEKTTEKYAEKLFGIKGEGLVERLAKLRTKSYQANIYDFKKKYKGKIGE